MSIVTGAKTTFTDTADHILDLSKGLNFLNPSDTHAIKLLKKLGTNGFVAKSPKHEWVETALAVRTETVTLADGSGTTLTVANAYNYQVNDLIRIENEVVRVTAIASATTLTIVRGYAGTTGAAHSSKTAQLLGSADPENSQAPEGVADTGSRLYNYVQTFTRGVELSNDEIAQLSTEGNHFTGQLKRRFIEINQQLAQAMIYGVRYEDTTNKIHTMGGLTQFVTTNVSNVGGAISVSAIDTQILAIVNAGGNPDIIAMSPYQKQKLDALDSSLVRIGKSDSQSKVGGNPDVMTWQSGVLDTPLQVVVDSSIKTDEAWILDSSKVKVGHMSNNGVNGSFHVEDATTPGQDGKQKVIRGKYTLKVENEKTHARLYGLS